MGRKFRAFISWIAWPGLLVLCMIATDAGFRLGRPVAAFYVTYAVFAVAVLLLERCMPHETAWLADDGQIAADVMHTLVSNSAIQALIGFSGAIGISALVTGTGVMKPGIWPHHWPLVLQIGLGLIVSEFAMYWAHRIAHEWTALWYFHAVHHSVGKLWVVNSGRFHFIDAIKSVLPGIAIVLAMGAPMDVVTWLSAIGAFVGTLTHCNIDMRFGALSVVFNTPELHRWHHSRVLREGNTNYGENIMLWDWVFGTWFNENRRPPADIGIADPMPASFRGQIVWPFVKAFGRRRVAATG